MKKNLLLPLLMLLSSVAFASTDHYILRDNSHVYHLKITKIADDIKVSADVDFEPNASETGKRACSADISGEAKSESENVLVMKRQMEGEAHFCTLKIQLNPTGAKLEQSKDCSYFAAGLCHFNTDGKELLKVK
ncbi:MAG: hypothetical protein HOP02_17425 [Methylococcaceae bacterium]|nr:hypothetical protein [Methylococcaceae bacterium]